MQHKSQLIKTKLHFPNEEADLCKFTGWLLTISIDWLNITEHNIWSPQEQQVPSMLVMCLSSEITVKRIYNTG